MSKPATEFLTDLDWQVYHACCRLKESSKAAIAGALLEGDFHVSVRNVHLTLTKLSRLGILKVSIEPGPEENETHYKPIVPVETLLLEELQRLRRSALQSDPELIAKFRELVAQELKA